MKQLLLLLMIAVAMACRPGVAAPPATTASLASADATATSPAAIASLASADVTAASPATPASRASADAPAASPSAPPAAAPVKQPAPSGPIEVQVVTSMGNFTIELLPERAPITVAQFLKLVDQGFYSGTLFHRVIPNFVIQGGGFDTSYKIKGSPPKVINESGNGLTNLRGTVGLARPAEPHAGDSQFYVNLFDNAALDPNQTRWGYAVFGKITQGMDVVDRIGNVATGAKGPFKEDTPLKQVVIERIERVASTP